jgi:AraC-like DNA-binding protein
MNTSTHLDYLSVFIFIGVTLGLILSFFFIIKSTGKNEANRYQGLLLLVLSLAIFEQFLNLTGYIVRVLPVTNTTEPLNLTIGPFLYLYVKKSLDQSKSRKQWLHFILFFFYLGYMFFDYIQSNEYKYNSYVASYHPEWEQLPLLMKISGDPLNIKKYLNPVTAIQMLFYIFLSFRLLVKKGNLSAISIFSTTDEVIKSLRNMTFHLLIVILIFVTVKLMFQGDLGDYFIGIYISVIILITTFRVMNNSTYFEDSRSFLDIYPGKYLKSSLTETIKTEILEKINYEFETNRYFTDNLASLSELAKRIGESPHHVSQVINEKLNLGFFDLLAKYRVEEAKRIFSDKKSNKITIEELSEVVGYNSKTAFNNAFKKLTGKTPSEYRKIMTS